MYIIVERTQEGRRIARQKPGYRDGRPEKYTEAQMGHALSLLREHPDAFCDDEQRHGQSERGDSAIRPDHGDIQRD